MTIEKTTDNGENKKKINLAGITLLAIGSLTGSGIYVLVGMGTKIAGPAVLLSIFLDLFVALLIACCYGECASIFPTNGGGFMYIKEAFGNKALLIGWIIWLSNMAYAALCAISVGIFIVTVFEIQISTTIIVIISISVVLLFSIFNVFGAKVLSVIQNPLTIALLGTYIIGAIYLFVKPRGQSFTPFFSHGYMAIFPASALIFDLFIGFEDIITISEEVENPRRTVPRGLLLSLLISALFFLLVVISLFATQPISAIEGSNLAFLDAVKSSFAVYMIVFLGAIFALLTSIGVALMAASRNLSALAKNDFIDRRWSTMNKKYDVPLKALGLTTILTVIILISGQVDTIALISNVSYILSVMFVALTVLKFRKMKAKEYTPQTFKIPFYPYSIYLTLFLCALLIIFIKPESIFITFGWFLIGIVIYLFFSGQKRIYGTIFLVVTFFTMIVNTLMGIFILIFGLIFYLFSLADRPSITLALSGLKNVMASMFGILLTIIFRYCYFSWGIKFLLYGSIIIAFISAFLDIVPFRDIFNWLEKAIDKKFMDKPKVTSLKIFLEEKKTSLVTGFSYGLGIILLLGSIFLLIFTGLLYFNVVTIPQIVIDEVVLSSSIFEFSTMIISFILGLILFFSGILQIMANLEKPEITPDIGKE